MELRHLRYFLAVAEQLHFGRAAEQLHISQPPLSRQIRDLERELNVQLFDRNGRVELTAAGTLLREHAARALDAADDFARAAERIAQEDTNGLRVGYPATMCGTFIAEVVQAFESQVDDADLSLVVGGSGAHRGDVERDVLDAAFVRGTRDWCNGLAALPVHREQFVGVLHANHPLARTAALTRAQLDGAQLVLPSQDTEPGIFLQLVADLLPGRELDAAAVSEAPTLESLYSTVAAGRGIGIISQSRAALLPKHTVVCRPFVAPAPTAVLLAVWKPDRMSAPLARFLDAVKTVSSWRHHGDRAQPGYEIHLDPAEPTTPSREPVYSLA